MTSLTVGYWSIRGRVQPIKYLLAYANADYKLVNYDMIKKDDGTVDRDSWLNEKYTFDFDFPNVPYLIDGEFKMTQTDAILEYLARKYNVGSDDPVACANSVMIISYVFEWFFAIAKMSYFSQDYLKDKEDFLKNDLVNFLEPIDSFLKGRAWSAGDQVSVGDFWLYEIINVQTLLSGDAVFEGFNNLLSFRDRFKQLPGIAECDEQSKHLAVFSDFAVNPLRPESN